MKNYLLNNLIAIDQLLNTILNGSPDETLSSRAYRADSDGKKFGKIFRPTIDLLFFWETHHCYTSYISELNRRQQPKIVDPKYFHESVFYES